MPAKQYNVSSVHTESDSGSTPQAARNTFAAGQRRDRLGAIPHQRLRRRSLNDGDALFLRRPDPIGPAGDRFSALGPPRTRRDYAPPTARRAANRPRRGVHGRRQERAGQGDRSGPRADRQAVRQGLDHAARQPRQDRRSRHPHRLALARRRPRRRRRAARPRDRDLRARSPRARPPSRCTSSPRPSAAAAWRPSSTPSTRSTRSTRPSWASTPTTCWSRSPTAASRPSRSPRCSSAPAPSTCSSSTRWPPSCPAPSSRARWATRRWACRRAS